MVVGETLEMKRYLLPRSKILLKNHFLDKIFLNNAIQKTMKSIMVKPFTNTLELD